MRADDARLGAVVAATRRPRARARRRRRSRTRRADARRSDVTDMGAPLGPRSPTKARGASFTGSDAAFQCSPSLELDHRESVRGPQPKRRFASDGAHKPGSPVRNHTPRSGFPRIGVAVVTAGPATTVLRAMPAPSRARVRRIRDRLRELYGRPFAPPHGQGLDELILTVLSQSTNDRNRDVAFLRCASASPAGPRSATRRTPRSSWRSAPAASRRSSPRGSRRSCARSTSPTFDAHLAARERRRRARRADRAPGRRPQDRGLRPAVRLRQARRPGRHARLARRARGSACSARARRSRSCTTRCSPSRRAGRSSSST